MKYNYNQFIETIKQKYPNEPFEILEYNGTSTTGIYYCGLCKKEYRIPRMGKLLDPTHKHVCGHCFASQYAEQVLDYFQNTTDLIFNRFGYKYNLHKPTVIYTCAKCNEETEKPYTEFLKYPTCIHCGTNAKRLVTATAAQKLPKGFVFIGEYQGQYTKTLVKHVDCGFIFSIRPKDLFSGHSYCPKCSKKASKGERAIIEYLTQNNIQFIKEKVFDWSDHKRYDFYLPQYNLLIEYNGIQHYQETGFQMPLQEQQEIDRFKQKVALEHGYNYLVIPYVEYDHISEILAQRLKENT